MCDLYPFERLTAPLPKDMYPFRNHILGPQAQIYSISWHPGDDLFFSGTAFEDLECEPVFYSIRSRNAFCHLFNSGFELCVFEDSSTFITDGEHLAQLPFNLYEASILLDMFGYDLEILSVILVIVSFLALPV